MHDGVEFTAVEPPHQVGRRHEIGHLPAAEIAPFAVIAKAVVDGNIAPPSLIEAGNEIRSDEPGPAGNQ